jgi:hypothetical protein
MLAVETAAAVMVVEVMVVEVMVVEDAAMVVVMAGEVMVVAMMEAVEMAGEGCSGCLQ